MSECIEYTLDCVSAGMPAGAVVILAAAIQTSGWGPERFQSTPWEKAKVAFYILAL